MLFTTETTKTGNEVAKERQFFMKGFVAGIAVMGMAFAVSSFKRVDAVGRNDLVSSVSPTVTIDKNEALVKCPLTPDLLYPKGKKISLSFTNAKNEVDNHGCPGIILPHGAPNQSLLFNPLECAATSTEVTVRVGAGMGCDFVWIKFTSQNGNTCGWTDCSGVERSGIFGLDCSSSSANLFLVRKPAQLPYIRPALATAAQGIELVQTNLTCPKFIIVSTNGQEEFTLETAFECTGDPNAVFRATASTGLPNGDTLVFGMHGRAGHAAVEGCGFSRWRHVGTANFTNVLEQDSNRFAHAGGAPMPVATLNAAGVPFTDTFTCGPQGLKFVY